MKFKKIMALVLAVVLAVTLLAACGNSQSGTETANTEQGGANSNETTGDSDWEYIQNKGEMVMGITLFAPMNYYDGEELVGFETEFATAVCDKLGIMPKFQEIDWGSKEIELNSKNIDCIWNGMTITEEREQNMSISTPYMNNRQVMVTRIEDADKYATNVDGADVVAEVDSTGYALLESDEFFANANATAVDSQAKGLMDVAAGTSDVAVVDYVTTLGSIGEGTDYTDLVRIDSKEFKGDIYGVAFRKGSDATEKVNQAMQELASDGTLAKLAEKYGLADLLLLK